MNKNFKKNIFKICLIVIVSQFCQAPSSLITKYEKQKTLDLAESTKQTRSLQTFLHHSRQGNRIAIPQEVAELIQEFLRNPERYFKMILPKYPSTEIKKAWKLVDKNQEQIVSFIKQYELAMIRARGDTVPEDFEILFASRMHTSFLFLKYLITIDQEVLNLTTQENVLRFIDANQMQELINRFNVIFFRHYEKIKQRINKQISRLYFNGSESNLKKNLEIFKDFIFRRSTLKEIRLDCEKIFQECSHEVPIQSWPLLVDEIRSKETTALRMAKGLDVASDFFVVVALTLVILSWYKISNIYIDCIFGNKMASSSSDIVKAVFSGTFLGYTFSRSRILTNKVRNKFLMF